jgi:hypothetical protein
MSHSIELSDEELAELDRLLQEGLEEARGELRRTENFRYHESVLHNVHLIEGMLETVRKAEVPV